MAVDIIGSSAIISADGLHRYALERVLTTEGERGKRTLGVFGVNPSTASAELEDPTTRRIAGFAQLWGFGRYLLGNEFAFRATDVNQLAHVSMDTAIGPENNVHIIRIMQESDVVVFAWGPLAKLPPRLRERWKDMVRMADDAGKVPHCIGPTASDKQPRHPLMLPYSAPLVPWPVPWFPNRARPVLHDVACATVSSDRSCDCGAVTPPTLKLDGRDLGVLTSLEVDVDNTNVWAERT